MLFLAHVATICSKVADLTGVLGRAAPEKPWPLQLFERVPRPRFTVMGDDGVSPYLTRVYLSPDADWWRVGLGLPGVFLHWFHRSDEDRELHSHPWAWSWSLVLWGGYAEERIGDDVDDWREPLVRRAVRLGQHAYPLIEKHVVRPGRLNFLRDRTFHRVTLIDPRGALTLFIAGPKSKLPKATSWGFLSRDGKQYESIGAREQRVFNERLHMQTFPAPNDAEETEGRMLRTFRDTWRHEEVRIMAGLESAEEIRTRQVLELLPEWLSPELRERARDLTRRAAKMAPADVPLGREAPSAQALELVQLALGKALDEAIVETMDEEPKETKR